MLWLLQHAGRSVWLLPEETMMKKHLKFALHTAILIEKQSLDFYRYAAKIVSNAGTRRMFELLAAEEAEHLGDFHNIYKAHEFGDLQGLLNMPPELGTPVYQSLIKAVETDTQEKEAMEIALREERACIELYSDLLITVNDPDARELFGQALRETQTHCNIIQEEYVRLMGRACDARLDAGGQQPANLIVINPKKKDSVPASRSGLTRQFYRFAPEDIKFH